MKKQTKINLDAIGYCDEPDKEYQKGLDSAKTLEELRKHVEYYEPLFPDAYKVVMLKTMDEEAFKIFRKGLKKERKGIFQGDKFVEQFGDIIIPALLLSVGVVAMKACVPFGCAYIRAKEIGVV